MTSDPALSPGRAFIIFAIVIITLAIAAALNSGGITDKSGTGTGTLTGNVSIGPLCPVEAVHAHP